MQIQTGNSLCASLRAWISAIGVAIGTCSAAWADVAPPWMPIDGMAIEGSTYVMTDAAHANFASLAYFQQVQPGDDRNKNNHGTDFALSLDGVATESIQTIGVAVHAICDGTVVGLRKPTVTVSHVVLIIQHPQCGPQGVAYKAYYGHMNAIVKVGDAVTAGQQLGTVRVWDEDPGSTFTHLHISLDTNTNRDLAGKVWYLCNETMSAEGWITSVTDCTESGRKLVPGPGQVRLRMGVQRVWADAYRDLAGVFHAGELYLTDAAMRQLGFVPYFDLLN